MRSLEPIVTEEDIRMAVIHPWFAGNMIISPSTLRCCPWCRQRALTLRFPKKTRRSLIFL
jgi:hypothetical protein